MAPQHTLAEEAHVQHVQKRQYKYYNLMAILGMAFGSVGMGYSASIIGTTLAQPSFISYFDLATRPHAVALISTTNGLFQAGSFFGALLINVVGDRWGRKMTIAIPSLLVLLSGALLAGSVNIGMFITFRFFSGMGSWWLLGAIPIWMSEITPPQNRGLLVDIHSASLLFGYCSASWIGAGFYFFHPAANNQWRAPLAFQCLPVTIVLAVMYWLPESPRWLMQQDRTEEAERILLKLHDRDEALVEMEQIRNQITVDSTLESSWMSLLTKKSYRKRTFITIGLSFGIQMTGVLVINNYGPTIYASLGYSTSQQLLYQGGFNTLGWGCGIMAIFIVDRFSRPRLIACGTAIVLACLVILAALIASYPPGPEQNKPALKAALSMIFLYIAFAELLLDGTQYIYFTEVWPNHLRAKGMTIAMGTIALVNIMWLQVAPTAFASIGWKFYLCFFIPGYIFAVCAWFLLPDTRHLALEEIAAIFGDAHELFIAHGGHGGHEHDEEKSDNAEVELTGEHFPASKV